MPKENDRVVIKLGPGRLDSDKAIQRELDTLREDVETKTTIPPGTYPTVDEVEDIVGEVISQIDVISVSPQFLGVPPGLQQFYFAAVVVDGTINMTDTVILENPGNINVHTFGFAQDYGNTLGAGANAVAGSEDGTDSSFAVYNFGNSFAGVKSFTPSVSGMNGFRAGENFSVPSISLRLVTSTSFPFVVFQNGTYSSISLARPSGYIYLSATGVSADGNYICSLWFVDSTSGTTNAVIVTHYLDGTIHQVSNPFPVSGGASYGIIDNGWIVLVNASGVWTAIASSSTVISNPLTLIVSALGTGYQISQNISRDGIFYFIDDGDLYKLDIANSLTSIYPDVLSRYDTSVDPPVLIGEIVVRSIHSATANTMAFGGFFPAVVNGVLTRYPIFCLVTIEENGAAISDTLFTQFPYTGGTTSQYPRVYNITSLENGRFVYAMDAGGAYPYYLINVAGPEQAP